MVELEKRGGAQGIAQLLGCETSMGLDPKVEGDASIEGRARLFGENRLPPVPPVSFWRLMVSQIHIRCLVSNPSLISPLGKLSVANYHLNLFQYENLQDPIILLLIAAAAVGPKDHV